MPDCFAVFELCVSCYTSALLQEGHANMAVFAWSPIVSMSQPSGIRCLIQLARTSTFCPVRQTSSRAFGAVAAICRDCANRTGPAPHRLQPNQNSPVKEGMDGECEQRGAATARIAKTQKVS
eukprot:239441-Chlamydomonas_euryale.AAC.3